MAHTKSETAWPYGSLLFCGHFGSATPGSRRLNRQGLLAISVLIGAVALTSALPATVPGGDYVLVVGAAAATLIVIRAYRIYFAGLDELSLRIQMEAVAFAFCAALLAAMVLGALYVVQPFEFNPALMVLAEPLRGVGLVRAARKYR